MAPGGIIMCSCTWSCVPARQVKVTAAVRDFPSVDIQVLQPATPKLKCVFSQSTRQQSNLTHYNYAGPPFALRILASVLVSWIWHTGNSYLCLGYLNSQGCDHYFGNGKNLESCKSRTHFPTRVGR